MRSNASSRSCKLPGEDDESEDEESGMPLEYIEIIEQAEKTGLGQLDSTDDACKHSLEWGIHTWLSQYIKVPTQVAAGQCEDMRYNDSHVTSKLGREAESYFVNSCYLFFLME